MLIEVSESQLLELGLQVEHEQIIEGHLVSVAAEHVKVVPYQLTRVAVSGRRATASLTHAVDR